MDTEACNIKRRVNSSRKRRRDPTGTTPAKGKIARQISFTEGPSSQVQSSDTALKQKTSKAMYCEGTCQSNPVSNNEETPRNKRLVTNTSAVSCGQPSRRPLFKGNASEEMKGKQMYQDMPNSWKVVSRQEEVSSGRPGLRSGSVSAREVKRPEDMSKRKRPLPCASSTPGPDKSFQECPGTPDMLFQDEDCNTADPQDSFNSSDTLFAQMNLSNLQESESANQVKEFTPAADDVVLAPIAMESSQNDDRSENTHVQEKKILTDGLSRTSGKVKEANDPKQEPKLSGIQSGNIGNLNPSCKTMPLSGKVFHTRGQRQQLGNTTIQSHCAQSSSYGKKESDTKYTKPPQDKVREEANTVPTKPMVLKQETGKDSCLGDDIKKQQTVAIKSAVSTPKPSGSLRDRIRQALQTNIKNTTPQATKSKQMREESVTKVISDAMETYQKTSEYDVGPFYGLPSRVREMLIQHRGIGKLYDWQNECLTLDTIQNRGNLIYSLPTSGGKTLVAEILIMKEILCRKKDTLLVLPFVSIVQEKVRTIAPFAADLDFIVEEYAGSRGRFPPRKRRNKHALYIATIEKANSLVNSLVELGRLEEIGLVVVDELHMLGEGGSRGATLEMCLAKVLYISKSSQIIGMSATLNNIQELQTFLSAEVYSNNFRPVQLKEYLKITDSIYEVNSKALCPEDQIQFSRMVSYKYPKEMQSRDPDHLVGMVMDVIPTHSCLLFCPTKKNCQNVVDMLCKLLPRTLRGHKVPGKKALLKALESDGNGTVCPVLKYTIPFGLAYHHSGLTMDERKLIEEAYSEGVLCLLACTSTLAAGVNLPAKRVILRAPFVGEHFISRAQYKQMVGRAGRAGIDSSGESVTIVKPQDKAKIIELIGRPFESCRSSLMYDDGKGLRTLILNLIGLKIATSRAAVSAFLSHTLFSVQCDSQQDQGFLEFTQHALQDLVEVGLVTEKTLLPADSGDEDILLEVTRLGQASFKGPIDIKYCTQLYQDLCKAQEALVVENSLHMLYLVTPYDMVGSVRPNWMIYFRQLSQLKPIELKAATIIGVPEGYITRKASGQRARQASIDEAVVSRFYLTLMIYSLMKQHSIWDVSEKFEVPRGFLQNLLSSAASFCACVLHFCEALEEMWPLRVLLETLVKNLSYCVTSELIPLMEVPGVKQGRARQLYKAGYKTLQDLAHAETESLVQNIQHMPRKVAYQIIAAAKVLISEKAESLLEEAEDLVAMPTDGVAGSVAVETDAMSVDGWSQDSQNQRWSQVSLKETPSQ
ncbi:helicase POLQ-like [Branchiostoma floridae]|uniref:Helicase POLQ-like n=1 Tax=Branchiostoma floridae TaxID=7739 RepID=A0A9J7MN19_BRAFL|nr:helicase POLQ-like [Branchiostoma floridae]